MTSASWLSAEEYQYLTLCFFFGIWFSCVAGGPCVGPSWMNANHQLKKHLISRKKEQLYPTWAWQCQNWKLSNQGMNWFEVLLSKSSPFFVKKLVGCPKFAGSIKRAYTSCMSVKFGLILIHKGWHDEFEGPHARIHASSLSLEKPSFSLPEKPPFRGGFFFLVKKHFHLPWFFCRKELHKQDLESSNSLGCSLIIFIHDKLELFL